MIRTLLGKLILSPNAKIKTIYFKNSGFFLASSSCYDNETPSQWHTSYELEITAKLDRFVIESIPARFWIASGFGVQSIFGDEVYGLL